MNRPSIDRTKTYRKVRKSNAQVGDAITNLLPIPGVSYYRVTNVQTPGLAVGGTKSRGTKVFGYYVAAKKKEDASKTSVDITHEWSGANPYLIERTASEKPAEVVENTPPPKLPEKPTLQIGIVKNDGETTVTLSRPGEKTLVARDDHPNFKAIWAKVCANEENGLADLFNIPKSVEIKFKRLSERLTIKAGVIYLDNDPVDNALSKQILKFLDDGREDWEPLVKFFEKVQQNPSDNSRKQLFAFLDANDFVLTPEGDIVVYKAVNRDGNGGYKSTRSGPGIVDGETLNDFLPNNPGSIVEMARSMVRDNPSDHCSVGLHVAAWRYAHSGPVSHNAILECHVNPRDVVSVPNDYSAQKVRCCRYRVIREVTKPAEGAVTA